MDRKRLIVDRFRRIWALVEYIASHPGCSRRALADEFALSERQLQADLNVIRLDMGIPLVRRHGYRLQPEDTALPTLGVTDARLLSVALQRAVEDGVGSPEAVRRLAARVPALFPPHLRPFLARALRPVLESEEPGSAPDVLGVVAEALAGGSPVRLRYGSGRNPALLAEPIVEPELVLPYRGGWYLIGHCWQRDRPLMFNLDAVVDASPAQELAETR